MAVKFFGQFLLEKGAVSSEDLLKAIDLQESKNLKFGATALSMGLLNREDFGRIHSAQRTEDLRFGDMAAKLGILTESQVEQVLTKQKNNHIYIGEALLSVGALTKEQLSEHLRAFKEDQSPYTSARVMVPRTVPEAKLWEMFADLTYKMLIRVVNLEFRPGPCEEVTAFDPADVVVAMDFSGTVSGRYLLSVPAEVQLRIAKAILDEEDVSEEPEEVLEDTVMEFANIVLGNVAAKGAQMGKNIDINPPEVLLANEGPIAVPAGRAGLLFPVHLAEGGQVQLALFIDR